MGAITGQSEPRRQNRPYRCYLLRCWLEEGAGPSGESAWRFTLRQADLDAVRLSFASLEDVAVYVAIELAACARPQRDAEIGGTTQGDEFSDSE